MKRRFAQQILILNSVWNFTLATQIYMHQSAVSFVTQIVHALLSEVGHNSAIQFKISMY